MIDPAILRPGRLDVKIKIERPNAQAARDIFAKYLNALVPFDAELLETHNGDVEFVIATLIEQAVHKLYATNVSSEFLEVTYANGERETLYFKDFVSGAMIESIVSRAKKMGIKRQLADGTAGITLDHLLTACDDGKKGERIVFMRTLIRQNGGLSGRAIDSPHADL